jgi:TrpR-related protein YerC/YecD
MDANEKRLTDQLCEVLASLTDAEEVRLFLADLCTVKEVNYMAQRTEAARLLMEGLTYQEVTERINISSATLTRVSKCVKADHGYGRVLRRYTEKKNAEEGK